MPLASEHTSTPMGALYPLVVELFTAEEFRRWLGLGPDADILVELPGESVSDAGVIEKALGALNRRGRIDAAFFTRMMSERARKSDVIAAVAALWCQPGRLAADSSGLTAGSARDLSSKDTSTTDPYCLAGTMAADEPTYVVRACDRELRDALRSAPFIAVEGPSEVGKSSLVCRVWATLAGTHRVCPVDLATLRCDDLEEFLSEFFERVSERLERTVKRWTGLVDGADAPLVLVLDEFGRLSARVVHELVPALVGLDRERPGCIQVVACLPVEPPGSISRFLGDRGVTAEKHRACWRPIRVTLFGTSEVEQLLAYLPATAAVVARAEVRTLVRVSGGLPAAVQRVCSKLFVAANRGVSTDELRAIIMSRGAYR
jgi:hypothetical protein